MGKKDWTSKANDIIIPIMGPTGAGKSTFINFILGKEVAKVGHDLKSCTTQLFPVVIDPSRNASLPSDRRLVLVDTPGFGDTYVDDSEILRRISHWLESMYSKQETKLAGIIYLHDISLTRISGIHRNLDVFQKLCGNGALRNVVLCTTKWSDIYLEDGVRRTEQLHTSYWREMIDHGSTVHKFEDSSDSAWEAVNLIVEANREKMEALQIQKELVDAHKLIPNTEAGGQLRYSLGQLLKNLVQTSKRDSSRHEELEAQIAVIRHQLKEMRIPVSQRVLGVLDLGVSKMLTLFTLTNRISPSGPGINKFLDKSLDKSTSTNHTRASMVPPVGARLGADVDNLILLLGETWALNATVLKCLAADVTAFGSDEVRCWSVEKGDRSQLIVEAPGFDSPGGMPRVFRNVRTWLSNSCREDMQFSIICVQHSRISVSPSPSETSHASGATELVTRFTLASSTLFATFTGEEQTAGEVSGATGQVDYTFSGSVASFRETREDASNMLDIALKKLVELDLLLNGLHAIAGNANAEVLILVMGETGCGKSTFINSAAGVTAIEVNGDMTSSSSTIQEASCLHPTSKKHFTLVEIPGFNNTDLEISDSGILTDTAKRLKERFNGVKFGGILYLQQKGQAQHMPPGVLDNDVIKQNLLHVVTTHRQPSGGMGASEQRDAEFPSVKGVAVLEQKRSAWLIIDQVLRKVEPKKLTVGLFHPELLKIARAVGGAGQGVSLWDWLLTAILDLRSH